MAETLSPAPPETPATPATPPTPPAPRRPAWPRAVLVVAAIAGLFLLFRLLPVAAWVEAFKGWVRGQGALGYVAYGVVYVMASLVPGGPAALLTVAGGAVFGVVPGTVVVSLSSTLAATLAYLLARTVFRSRVERGLAGNPRLLALSRAIERDGVKIVALVRLSPLFPFTVVNWAFGLTPVRPVAYVVTSWLAMLPGTVAYVYLGSAVGNVASGAGPVQKGIHLALAAAAVVATAVIARFAARAIRSAGIEAPPAEVSRNPGAPGA